MSNEADEFLTKLLEGNKRYRIGKMEHPHQSLERRKEVLQGQKPFAVIIGCSDSRVPPEIIFDQGIGDLFVVRLAGNLVDDFALGSVEYAVQHLYVKLLVVLGHQNCGAIKAAMSEEEYPEHIESVLHPLRAVVEKRHGDYNANVIAQDNVERVVEELKLSLVEFDKIKIVGAYYHLNTGLVEII